jgi:hypothetical protein
MKKYHVAIMLVFAFTIGTMFGGMAFADDSNIILWINGQRMDWRDPAPPVMIDDRIYVPLRAVSETLGASVEWDDDHNTAYIAGYRDPATIEIEGPDSFKRDMQECLALLQEKDPDGYKLVGTYTRKIVLDDNLTYSYCNAEPMWVRFPASKYKTDKYWWSGILVHEAMHAKQKYDFRYQVDSPWDRDQRETEAYTAELQTFTKIGSPQLFIDDTRKWIRDKLWQD